MRIPIAREGYPFLMPPALVGLLCVLFPQTRFGWCFWLSVAVTAAMAFFFRDPERTTPSGDQTIVAPADGKIVLIQEVKYPALGDDLYWQVSIFMSLLDVHINRAPMAGTVADILYKPGQFFNAAQNKASLLNEQNAIIFFRTINGHTVNILVKQIAGLVARRIVCYAQPGMHFEKGQRIGLIRFGSRVDLVLPHTTALAVQLNDRVKGGETVLGTLENIGSSG